MTPAVQNPFRDPAPETSRWLVIFIVLSLLAHVLLLLIIVLLARFMPPLRIPPPPKDTEVTLSILPTPPPAPAPKPTFMPTQPQQNIEHKQQLIQSANDTVLKSKEKTANAPDSLMPEVRGNEKAPDLRTAPQVKAPETPQVSTTQPTPKTPSPQKPTPPGPQQPKVTQTTTQPPTPNPAKQQAHTQPKPTPQIDPDTGLPVLPPIAAPTMSSSPQPRPLAPTPSQQQAATSMHGALGMTGDTSPAAMATELGKYKQYVYSVVGTYWYPDINQHFGTIGVGTVSIRYTIHADGTLTDVSVTAGDSFIILRDISKNALMAPAPFNRFSDAMIKELGTDSYTDEFSFSVY
jgi:outer membrane biosynthesis protein TonB